MKNLIIICTLINLGGGFAFTQTSHESQAETRNAGIENRTMHDAGPVYESKEVDKRAIILEKIEPGYTEEAQLNKVEGVVFLSVVLSSSGKVMDINVIKGLPHGLTEKGVTAAKKIKFTPAVKEGKQVSTRVKLAYYFILPGKSFYGDSSKKVYYRHGCTNYRSIGPNEFVVFKNEQEANESGYSKADCP